VRGSSVIGDASRRARARLAVAVVVAAAGLAACGGGAKPAAAPAAPSTTVAPPATTPPPTTAPTQAPSTTVPSTTVPSTTVPSTTKPKPARPRILRAGMQGANVAAVQRRLAGLGYEVTEVDGRFGQATRHAVVAFQKVNGLDRDGAVGPRTRQALARPRTPRPRSASGAMHLEVDLTRQVVLVVKGAKVAEILDSSTASGRPYVSPRTKEVHIARTPVGSFRVQRKLNGWRKSDLGLLWRPAYFTGGYAVHGSLSVPPFPASHGCVRLTMASMNRLYDRLPVGTPVLVYRS
jgi:peptidoglycan hydrolase-like protein with peptidoglycan-binding domain